MTRVGKHIQFANIVRERIKTGSYPQGSQLPTQKVFAKEFENRFSEPTIKKGLRELEDDLIERKWRQGIWVKKAPEVESQKPILIGRTIPYSVQNNPYWARFVIGALSEVNHLLDSDGPGEGQKCILTLAWTEEDSSREAKTVRELSKVVHGIIAVSAPSFLPETKKAYAAAKERGIQIIIADHAADHDPAFPLFRYSDRMGGYMATRLLLESGCRRLFFVSDTRGHHRSDLFHLREHGWAEAIQYWQKKHTGEGRLKLPNDWKEERILGTDLGPESAGCHVLAVLYSKDVIQFQERAKKAVAEFLSGLGDLSDVGFVCSYDTLAVAIYDLIEQDKNLPSVRLTGYDDNTQDTLFRGISSVRQRAEALAAHCVQELRKMILAAETAGSEKPEESEFGPLSTEWSPDPGIAIRITHKENWKNENIREEHNEKVSKIVQGQLKEDTFDVNPLLEGYQRDAQGH